MKLRPLHDRVIIKRLDNERKTASGIVIPETAAEKPDQGEILAVGNGKVGDDGKVRRQPEWRPPVDLNREAPPAGPEAPEDGGRGALAQLLVERLGDHTTDLELSAEKLLGVHDSLDQETQKDFAQAVKRLAAVCGQLCVLADATGEPAERQTVGDPL